MFFFLKDVKGRITILSSPVPLPVNGMWFIGANLQNMRHGWNEPATAGFVKKTLKRGDTFIDIGANYGFYSVLAAKCGANVVSYEPDSTSFNRLKWNLFLNGVKAELHKSAVADYEGFTDFYIAEKGSGLNSTRREVLSTIKEKISVKTEQYAGRYDLCKIDVEGAELSVLKGMPHKGLIICELNPKVQNRQGSSPKAFLDGIRLLGWSIEDIEEGVQSDEYLIAKAYKNSVLNLLLKSR